ncbi:MAG: prepilin-type N-terminal cleavage/methylation domain-containing protein [Candidatus Omnitrophica bacterium]|nr:prepilin-type N-terminal cleavage/methylation domain-containing protein [Candidatus Omnitrophota bacterium]
MNRMKMFIDNKRGFTLLEIMVVVLILGILTVGLRYPLI